MRKEVLGDADADVGSVVGVVELSGGGLVHRLPDGAAAVGLLDAGPGDEVAEVVVDLELGWRRADVGSVKGAIAFAVGDKLGPQSDWIPS